MNAALLHRLLNEILNNLPADVICAALCAVAAVSTRAVTTLFVRFRMRRVAKTKAALRAVEELEGYAIELGPPERLRLLVDISLRSDIHKEVREIRKTLLRSRPMPDGNKRSRMYVDGRIRIKGDRIQPRPILWTEGQLGMSTSVRDYFDQLAATHDPATEAQLHKRWDYAFFIDGQNNPLRNVAGETSPADQSCDDHLSDKDRGLT